jgi:hypothetical protein
MFGAKWSAVSIVAFFTFLFVCIFGIYGWLQKKRELSEKVLSDFIKFLV